MSIDTLESILDDFRDALEYAPKTPPPTTPYSEAIEALNLYIEEKTKGLKTGQEWYDRIEPAILSHGFYEEVSREYMLEAAKRASGLK